MWEDIKQLLFGAVGIGAALAVIILCFEVLLALKEVASALIS